MDPRILLIIEGLELLIKLLKGLDADDEFNPRLLNRLKQKLSDMEKK